MVEQTTRQEVNFIAKSQFDGGELNVSLRIATRFLIGLIAAVLVLVVWHLLR
jgi:hypothetical protein